jgi:hypothetical protein
MTFLSIYNLILQIFHAKPIKRGILGAITIILSKDIDKYAFVCGSNFFESDVNLQLVRFFCQAKTCQNALLWAGPRASASPELFHFLLRPCHLLDANCSCFRRVAEMAKLIMFM